MNRQNRQGYEPSPNLFNPPAYQSRPFLAPSLPQYPQALTPTNVTLPPYTPTSRMHFSSTTNAYTPSPLKRKLPQTSVVPRTPQSFRDSKSPITRKPLPATSHQLPPFVFSGRELAHGTSKVEAEPISRLRSYSDISPNQASAMELAYFRNHGQKTIGAIRRWLDKVEVGYDGPGWRGPATDQVPVRGSNRSIALLGTTGGILGVNKFVVPETSTITSKDELVNATPNADANRFGLPNPLFGGQVSDISTQPEEKLVKKMESVLEEVKMMGQQEMQRERILELMKVMEKIDEVVFSKHERLRALRQLNGTKQGADSPGSNGLPAIFDGRVEEKSEKSEKPEREEVSEEKLMATVESILAKADAIADNWAEDDENEILELVNDVDRHIACGV